MKDKNQKAKDQPKELVTVTPASARLKGVRGTISFWAGLYPITVYARGHTFRKLVGALTFRDALETLWAYFDDYLESIGEAPVFDLLLNPGYHQLHLDLKRGGDHERSENGLL